MKDFLKVYWPLILLAIIGMIVALSYVDPAPPERIRMATGSPGGAYAAYGERYQALLADHGVEVELLETAGTLDNLRMLTVGDADVALLQGGIATAQDSAELATLGGMFLEPLWVFARTETGAQGFADLRGLRVAIGADGSGTRAAAQNIQAEFGGTWPETSQIRLSGQTAVDALMSGELDVAIFSAGIEAPYIETLLSRPDVTLIPFERAGALSRRRPALAEITLLRGVVNVGEDIPAGDIPMIASVAQLGVRQDLHPAIQSILLEAAVAIHSQPGLLAEPGSFPTGEPTALPLTPEAERYYRDGPSTLRRYFSFSVANFLERAWVLLIPLITLLIPLVRVAPPIYRWRVRRKIYVWYTDLRDLESRGRAAKTPAEHDLIRQHLSQLQTEIGKLEVPLSYTDDVYRLRSHVAFVNQLLGNLDPKQKIEPPAA